MSQRTGIMDETNSDYSVCHRCGKGITTTPVYRELKLGTDLWFIPGQLDSKDSQGVFPFGKNCAYRVLENTKTEIER